jgi:hypothetical protein
MSYIFKKGATSQSIELYIVDSTNGTPETGVLWNTAGIDLKYRRKDAVVVSITEADLTTPLLTDTWESGGFLEIGNGVYRLDLPDAALASSAGIDRVVVFGTVTGMVVLPVTIHLTDFDLNSDTPNVNVASEDNIDFGAAKKSSLNAAATDLSAITDDKASYKATGYSTHNAAAVKSAIEAGGSTLAQILTDTSAQDTTTKLRTMMTGADTPVCKDSTPPTVGQIQTEIEENGASLLDTIRDELSNATDGLSALKTLLDAIAGYIDTEVGAIKEAIENGTYGLSALKTRGDSTWVTATGFSTHDAAAVKSAIEAAGSHLTLIKAITDNLPNSGALSDIATNAARLTAVRAAVLTEWIDGGRLDLLIDAIKAVTDLINGLLEDSGGYRYTAKALEEAPSGAGLTGTQNTALILIRDIMEGDATIDITTTPWQLVIKKKGTSTEVVKKDLKDVNGVNIAAVTTVIGQQLEP